MTIERTDHVGIVVAGMQVATELFVELELGGRRS